MLSQVFINGWVDIWRQAGTTLDHYNKRIPERVLVGSFPCHIEPMSVQEGMGPEVVPVGYYQIFIDGKPDVRESDVASIEGKEYDVEGVKPMEDVRIGYTELRVKAVR